MHTFPWKTTPQPLESGGCEILVTILAGREGEKSMVLNSITTIGEWGEVEDFAEAYPNVPLIQDALPFLSLSDREFLISGLTPEEWEEMFPEEGTHA